MTVTEDQLRTILKVLHDDAKSWYGAWRVMVQSAIDDEYQRVLAKVDQVTAEVNRQLKDSEREA